MPRWWKLAPPAGAAGAIRERLYEGTRPPTMARFGEIDDKTQEVI
jgi:hypothetical protein